MKRYKFYKIPLSGIDGFQRNFDKGYVSAIKKIEKYADLLNYGKLPYGDPENTSRFYEEMLANFYFEHRIKQNRSKFDRAIQYLTEYMADMEKIVEGDLLFWKMGEDGRPIYSKPENIWHDWDQGVPLTYDPEGASMMYTCKNCGIQHFQ